MNYCRPQNSLREKKPLNFITFVLQQRKLRDRKAKAKNVTEEVNRRCGFLLEHFEQNSHFKKAEEHIVKQVRRLRTLFRLAE